MHGDRELEVRTATYGPGIDQSQHVKSVSHIINDVIANEQLSGARFSVQFACTLKNSTFFVKPKPAQVKKELI